MPNKPIYQSKPLYPDLLWQRPVHFYKTEAGKILIIAGSNNMSGSAIMACEAVFRSGTGILLLGFPESLKDICKNILPDAMMLPLPETNGATLSSKSSSQIIEKANVCDANVIGPGLSQNSETVHLIWQIIFQINKPVVLVEDGLQALIKGIQVIRSQENNLFLSDYFRKKPGDLILIIHPKEALKIIQAIKPDELKGIKLTDSYACSNKNIIALMISHYLNSIVIFKGHDNIVCGKEEQLVINKSEELKVDILGSNNILSGIVGSFISQNPNQLFEACCTSTYLYELTLKIATQEINYRNILASDLLRFLPSAIKKAESDI